MHFLLLFHFFCMGWQSSDTSLVLSLLTMDFTRSRTVVHIYNSLWIAQFPLVTYRNTHWPCRLFHLSKMAAPFFQPLSQPPPQEDHCKHFNFPLLIKKNLEWASSLRTPQAWQVLDLVFRRFFGSILPPSLRSPCPDLPFFLRYVGLSNCEHLSQTTSSSHWVIWRLSYRTCLKACCVSVILTQLMGWLN